MKNLFIALVATILFSGVSFAENIKFYEPFESYSNELNTVEDFLKDGREQSHQVCISVSIIVVTIQYCYTPKTENKSSLSLLEPKEELTGEIVKGKEGRNDYLIISGFDKSLNELVKGETTKINDKYTAIEGEYRIINGSLKVNLRRN